MLCQRCREREATILLTQIVGEQTTKRDLCTVCRKELVDFANTGGRAGRFPLLDERGAMLDELAAKDSRYAKDACSFVQDGMAKAMSMFWQPGKPGHISATQLLESHRELAIESFDKQTGARLNSWSIFKCEDFGEIVFNLVGARLLTRRTGDTKADFEIGYDFDTAFPS